MFRRPKRRHGITLIEIVVILSIIGLLAALLLAALHQVRESARRTQCMNNLKQMGIAINMHLDAKKMYPRGENNYSAFVSLLPFLDNSALYNSVNLSKPQLGFSPTSSVNATAFAVTLNVFVCPSEDAPLGGLGPTNYGGNLGTGVGPYGRPVTGPFASSLLDPAIRDSLVRDGLANTVAVSEFCRGRGMEHRDGIRSAFLLGAYEKDQFSNMLADCTNLDPNLAPLSMISRGLCWAFDGIGYTLYDHNISPNGHTCSTQGLLAGAWTASSAHPGCVNCLLLDGHVRKVSSPISLATWHSLGTMNGGEITQE